MTDIELTCSHHDMTDIELTCSHHDMTVIIYHDENKLVQYQS
jgi:hypothetical protein